MSDITNPSVVNVCNQGYDSLPVQVPALGTPTSSNIFSPKITGGGGVAIEVDQNKVVLQNFNRGNVQNVFP